MTNDDHKLSGEENGRYFEDPSYGPKGPMTSFHPRHGSATSSSSGRICANWFAGRGLVRGLMEAPTILKTTASMFLLVLIAMICNDMQ